MRQIIQLVQISGETVALANDGTTWVWRLHATQSGKAWCQFAGDLPQPEGPEQTWDRQEIEIGGHKYLR